MKTSEASIAILETGESASLLLPLSDHLFIGLFSYRSGCHPNRFQTPFFELGSDRFRRRHEQHCWNPTGIIDSFAADMISVHNIVTVASPENDE